MTTNQINYFKVKEDQRHNLEMEKLTGQQTAETARSNLERERQNLLALQETATHNRNVEALTRSEQAIKQEYNRSVEALNSAKTTNQLLNNALDSKYAEVDRVTSGGGDILGALGSVAKGLVFMNQGDVLMNELNSALEAAGLRSDPSAGAIAHKPSAIGVDLNKTKTIQSSGHSKGGYKASDAGMPSQVKQRMYAK